MNSGGGWKKERVERTEEVKIAKRNHNYIQILNEEFSNKHEVDEELFQLEVKEEVIF